MTYPAIALPSVTGRQKEVIFNSLIEAMSRCAIFGIKRAVNLEVELYGGNLYATDGTLIAVANAAFTLTASNTNYVSCSAAGIVSVTTVSPAGWPGPLAGAARALYAIVAGANSITSITSYLKCFGQGPTGATGPQGPAGDELWLQRKRVIAVDGYGTTSLVGNTADFGGFDVSAAGGPSLQAKTADSTTFEGGIVTVFIVAAGGANTSVQEMSQGFCTMGNAAGRGGFKVDLRFLIGSPYAGNTTMRSFIGLIDPTVGTIGATDPSSLVNMVGVGADTGDANLSVFCNDGSGSATKTTLGANFPARAADNVYELTLEAQGNTGTVTYTITNRSNGNASGPTPLSSNVPAATAFLSWVLFVGKAASATNCGLGFQQITAYTRY